MFGDDACLKKIKVGFAAFAMLITMLLSDRAEVLILYVLSATLHETGHLLAARRLNIGIKEIRFEFSGVRICTEEKLTSYKGELIMALAGPLASIMISVLSVAVLSFYNISVSDASQEIASFIEGKNSLFGALGFFALSSLLQGGVNLLPVRSFDGGRAAYCLLAMIFSEGVADRVLELTSIIFAFSLWTFALYLMLMVSAGLGIFVFSACIFLSTIQRKPSA